MHMDVWNEPDKTRRERRLTNVRVWSAGKLVLVCCSSLCLHGHIVRVQVLAEKPLHAKITLERY